MARVNFKIDELKDEGVATMRIEVEGISPDDMIHALHDLFDMDMARAKIRRTGALTVIEMTTKKIDLIAVVRKAITAYYFDQQVTVN